MHKLPDGSGFFVGSLPQDHWLYTPQCPLWDVARDASTDTPLPILDNSQRKAVIDAVRWAVRGTTMRGTAPDFDPDALVLNAAYALCGPCGTVTPNVQDNRASLASGETPVDRRVGPQRLGKDKDMKHCDGCTTPRTCATHGCAVPTEAQRLERAKDEAQRALVVAERAWHAYAALCDVGHERTRAFEVFENVRRATVV